MKQIGGLAARLSATAPLADLLAAGFDAFEAIRAAARACEDSQPGLLAAFMTAAGAAVEGRNALTAAPSLPPGGCGAASAAGDLATASRGDVGEVADALAEFAELVASRMSAAASTAADAGDRAACTDAAGAARQIQQLLAGSQR